MTEQEAQKLCFEISIAFPNWKGKENSQATVSLWANVLKEDKFEDLHIAFLMYCRKNNEFAPTPGQLLDLIASTRDTHMTDAEAWALVSKAIRNSAYYSDEEFAKLPEEVQRAVGSPNQLAVWATDEDYNEGVTQSNFLRAYRQVQTRKHEERLLPQKLRDALMLEAKV